MFEDCNCKELDELYCSATDDSTLCDSVDGYEGGNPTEDDWKEGECHGLTMEEIDNSKLSDERKETVKSGFKQVVRGGYVAKAALMRPANFPLASLPIRRSQMFYACNFFLLHPHLF